MSSRDSELIPTTTYRKRRKLSDCGIIIICHRTLLLFLRIVDEYESLVSSLPSYAGRCKRFVTETNDLYVPPKRVPNKKTVGSCYRITSLFRIVSGEPDPRVVLTAVLPLVKT